MIRPALLLSPRPLETPEVGLVIQQGDRMCMFRAWPRVGVVFSKAAFILRVFAATVCVGQPAEAQSGRWCAFYNAGDGGGANCGFATLEQCLADVRGIGGNCGPSPYPSSPQSTQSTRPRRR